MGKGLIISGGEAGLYQVQITYDRTRYDKEIAKLNNTITSIDSLIAKAEADVTAIEAEIAAIEVLIATYILPADSSKLATALKNKTEKQVELMRAKTLLSIYKIQKTSVTKRKEYLQDNMPADPTIAAWCADLTEDLTGTVGTVEIGGELNKGVVIMPGYDGAAAFDMAINGQLQPSISETPEQAIYNLAMMPGWQKWMPTYRIGVIKSINSINDTCSVALYSIMSRCQGLPINQGDVYDRSIYIGWEQFIKKNPDFALANNGDATVDYSEALLTQLQAVNDEVNNGHAYKKDYDNYGVPEYWTLLEEGQAGDCEDLALTKAQKLIDAGIDADAIHLEVGKFADTGNGHCWLTIQTSAGDYIMDNMVTTVIPSVDNPYLNAQRQFGGVWDKEGVTLNNVPIEYMD